MSEQIVTGKKYRILTDVAQKIWQRVSFWTKASDVEFNDAKTAETKVGAINGITDSLTANSSNIAASSKALTTLNGNINQLNSERNIFSRSFNYTELISGSENYSAGYVIIAKVNRVVIANVDVYFKTGLTPGVAHQILSKSQLVDINCWIPTPTGNQSYAFESIAISGVNKNLAIIGLNGSDNAANGLTIYPLDVPTGVGDHIRHQLIWVSE